MRKQAKLHELVDALPERPDDIMLQIAKRLRSEFQVPATYEYTGGGCYLIMIEVGDLRWEFGNTDGWQWSKSKLAENYVNERYDYEFLEGGPIWPGDTDQQDDQRTAQEVMNQIMMMVGPEAMIPIKDLPILLATGARAKLEQGGRTFCNGECGVPIPKGAPRIRTDGYGLLCPACAVKQYQAKYVAYVGINPDPEARVKLGNIFMTTRIDPEDGCERPCLVCDPEQDGASVDLILGTGERIILNISDFTKYEAKSDEEHPQVANVDVIPMAPTLHNTVILFTNPNTKTGHGVAKVTTEHGRINAEWEGQSGEAISATVIRRVK